MTQEIKKVTRGSRPKRATVVPVGPLHVTDKDPERVYRHVTDKNSRIAQFEQNGWVVESADKHQVGDRRLDNKQSPGSAARYPVGLGDHAVLMSIDKDWYEEDQKAKAERVDATEQTIREKVSKLSISRG